MYVCMYVCIPLYSLYTCSIPVCMYVFLMYVCVSSYQELQLSSKDKGSLRSLWQRVVVGSNHPGAGAGASSAVFREEQERELELSSSALLADDEAA